MMDLEELKGLEAKFQQGLERLRELSKCLETVGARRGLALETGDIDKRQGELSFWFAGTRYYVRVRLTDRTIDDVGMPYGAPIGWLDWGRCDADGRPDRVEQSDFYDGKGVMCESERQAFHSDLKDCDDRRLEQALLHTLQRLVSKTIAVNNAGAG